GSRTPSRLRLGPLRIMMRMGIGDLFLFLRAPAVEVLSHETVVGKLWVAGVEAVDACCLATAQHLGGVEAMGRAHEALAPSDPRATRDAAGEAIGDVEDDAVAVGHHGVEREDLVGHRA